MPEPQPADAMKAAEGSQFAPVLDLASCVNQALQHPTRGKAPRGKEEDEAAPRLNSQFSSFTHDLLLLIPSSPNHWQILHNSRPSTPPSLPDCSRAQAFLSLLLVQPPHSHLGLEGAAARCLGL